MLLHVFFKGGGFCVIPLEDAAEAIEAVSRPVKQPGCAYNANQADEYKSGAAHKTAVGEACEEASGLKKGEIERQSQGHAPNQEGQAAAKKRLHWFTPLRDCFYFTTNCTMLQQYKI